MTTELTPTPIVIANGPATIQSIYGISTLYDGTLSEDAAFTIGKEFTYLGSGPLYGRSQGSAKSTVAVTEIVSGGLVLKGDWDADTNTPDIDAIAEDGDYWIVTVAGDTELDGIGNWLVGEEARYYGGMWTKGNSQVNAIVRTGIETKLTSVPSFDDGTREFTITPVGTFYYYQQGVRYGLTAPESIIIPNAEGVHYIYFDGTVLKTTQTFSRIIVALKATLAVIYWDQSKAKQIYFGDERHAFMDSYTHIWLHTIIGAVLENVSNFALTDIITDGDGDLDVSAQFGVTRGVVVDEDNYVVSDPIVSTSGYAVYYRVGATDWEMKEADGFPLIYSGDASGFVGAGGRAAYNEDIGGGVFQLTELTNQDYVGIIVCGTTAIAPERRVIAVLGQEEYSTAAAAREGILTLVDDLNTEGFLFTEIVPLYGIVYQSNNLFANTPKAKCISVIDPVTGEDVDAVDLRGQIGLAGGATGGSAGSTQFVDSTFQIYDDVDSSKRMQFELEEVGTGETQTLGIPNRSGIVVLESAMLGYISYGLFVESTDANEIRVTPGSAEIDGKIYTMPLAELVSAPGGSPMKYVYATPTGSDPELSYSVSALGPTYEQTKGGYYSGASRMIGVIYFNTGTGFIDRHAPIYIDANHWRIEFEADELATGMTPNGGWQDTTVTLSSIIGANAHEALISVGNTRGIGEQCRAGWVSREQALGGFPGPGSAISVFAPSRYTPVATSTARDLAMGRWGGVGEDRRVRIGDTSGSPSNLSAWLEGVGHAR